MLLYGNKVKATLKLTNQANGAATAQFIVVGKRENILPVELVRQDGDWLLVDVAPYRMTFEGRLAQGLDAVDRHVRAGTDGNAAGAATERQMIESARSHCLARWPRFALPAPAQSMFRGDAAHSGTYSGAGPRAMRGVKWKFPTGGRIVGFRRNARRRDLFRQRRRQRLCRGRRHRTPELEVHHRRTRFLHSRGGRRRRLLCRATTANSTRSTRSRAR